MSNRYNIVYRITYYLIRFIVFGFLQFLLAGFADRGSKACEELLSVLKEEQRDCENVHNIVYIGAYKVFASTLLFIFVSRYV